MGSRSSCLSCSDADYQEDRPYVPPREHPPEHIPPRTPTTKPDPLPQHPISTHTPPPNPIPKSLHHLPYKFLLPPQLPEDVGKKTLVLDIDETLVHSNLQPIQNASYMLPIQIEDAIQVVYVQKRPGLDRFLERMSQLYELVIFTASVSAYAEQLFTYFEQTIGNHSSQASGSRPHQPRPHQVGTHSRNRQYQQPTGTLIRHILHRKHCTVEIDPLYTDARGNSARTLVKDLSKLGRMQDSICLLDNTITCGKYQPQLTVVCGTWVGEEDDRELKDLIPFFERMAASDLPVDQFLRLNRVWIDPRWLPPLFPPWFEPPHIKLYPSDQDTPPPQEPRPFLLFEQPLTFPLLTDWAIDQRQRQLITSGVSVEELEQGYYLADRECLMLTQGSQEGALDDAEKGFDFSQHYQNAELQQLSYQQPLSTILLPGQAHIPGNEQTMSAVNSARDDPDDTIITHAPNYALHLQNRPS
ncbi:putative Carboxy-terminal domain RNA polymerase II polypeptide A small phosphatase 1 [Blattamonas nauphoetae]|uniref:Mitochondrial import inner membrane translocase subunit TIM50 n=1 Tax=Blattamonas nauphoetae TaxID=2049346 RepID=A0ABQ9XRV7_9EUKA|nr:putative Carboxy-terminal domain RNA polymerase II polypeptide A small phosphatase 1 [Blattamonas nauphoetae]